MSTGVGQAGWLQLVSCLTRSSGARALTHRVRKPYAGLQMPVHVQAIDIHGQPMTIGGEQFTMHVDGMPPLFFGATSLQCRG